MIALQELHIVKEYGLQYWQAACANVDAGFISGGNTDYEKVASVVTQIRGIKPPSINNSEVGFSIHNDSVLFGLAPLQGINPKESQYIIDNRPYTSIEDFHSRCVKDGMLSDLKMMSLIKAGCFDEFEPGRKKAMTILLQLAKPKKAKLTMTNVKDAEFVKCMPSGYQELVDYHFEMKEAGSAKGKEYNTKVKPLKEWLKTEEAINIESSLRRNAYAKERCPGSVEQWEFEALNLYLGKHWVSTCGVVMDDWKSAPIVDFGQKYDKVNIAGTIIGYNNNKRTVTLQTINGDVVIVKIQAKLWNKFSEETKNNPSWFIKGSSLVMFVMKRGNNSAFLQAGFGDREAVIGKVIGRGNIRYEK